MSESAKEMRRRDRLEVVHDGEKKTVFNWVNVTLPAVIYAGAGQVEHFEADIGAGDSSMAPDAVTHWIAEELSFEFHVDVEQHDIGVIDPTADEVDVR